MFLIDTVAGSLPLNTKAGLAIELEFTFSRTPGAEPLCSIYDKNCITYIRPLPEQNQLKITTALEGLKTRVISFDNEAWFNGNAFADINSDEGLQQFENNNKNKSN